MSAPSKNQKTFRIEWTTADGEVLDGTFTVKRLSIRDRSRMGVRKSQLSGGMYCVRDADGNPTGQGLDEETDYANSIIAHLEMALVQKPTWFDLAEVYDVGLANAVYKEVLDFEGSFRWGRRTGDLVQEYGRGREATGGTSDPQGVHGNGATPVVGEEVRAALEP